MITMKKDIAPHDLKTKANHVIRLMGKGASVKVIITVCIIKLIVKEWSDAMVYCYFFDIRPTMSFGSALSNGSALWLSARPRVIRGRIKSSAFS
jgi:hypothetical protein